MTPDSLIDLLGGTSTVASAMSVRPPVVSNWRARGKIPSDRWSDIVAIAASRGVKGITIESIAEMHARRLAAPADALVARP